MSQNKKLDADLWMVDLLREKNTFDSRRAKDGKGSEAQWLQV